MPAIRPSRRLLSVLLLTGSLLLLALGSAGPVAGVATTYTVNSTGDTDADGCGDAECTLREAITAANANAGVDTIAFNIPGAGPHTIQPTSQLPLITDAAIIDGYTEPGSSVNTLAQGTNAVLMIELDGTNAGAAGGLFIHTGGGVTIRGLVINRFGTDGILMHNTATGSVIEGNFIGTNTAGTAAGPGSADEGVDLDNSHGNTIGGTSPAARNLISGNGDNGIDLEQSAANNTIIGNLIGTDATGTGAVQNGQDGVGLISASGTLITGNVISGNDQDGIFIQSGATTSTVTGNFIGTNAAGTAAVGNGADGVDIETSDGHIVGGTGAGAANVISGNGEEGVEIDDGAAANTVQGNLIGTNAAGTAAVPNAENGVQIDFAPGNLIGGTAAAARNVISGNGANGVELLFDGTVGNSIQGNLIGTDVNGLPMGNTLDGVWAGNSGQNFIGGTDAGAGNVIAYNGGNGVTITFFPEESTQKSILGNSIHDNTGLGIDLDGNADADFGSDGDGVTPNDTDDPDTGPNELQNYPVLTSAELTTSGFVVEGTLNSLPDTEFDLEFFASAACDPSGYGEGTALVGRDSVGTSSGGDASFSFTFPAFDAPAGSVITATATDPAGNTSEFSACETLVDTRPTSSPTASASPGPTTTGSPGPTASPGATATPRASGLPNTADADGLPGGSGLMVAGAILAGSIVSLAFVTRRQWRRIGD